MSIPLPLVVVVVVEFGHDYDNDNDNDNEKGSLKSSTVPHYPLTSRPTMRKPAT